MTIVGPLLMGSIFLVPILLAKYSDEQKTIAVIDNSGLFEGKLNSNDEIKFQFLNTSLDKAKAEMKEKEYDGVVLIPSSVITNPQGISMYSEKQPSMNVVNYIERVIQKRIEADKLIASGVEQEVLDAAKTNVKIKTFKITETGDESSSSGLSTTIGFVSGFLIYLFIFLYGAQVMRGVIEEKTNRIVEVIISSVKPFQLMFGKIVGIAMVGLTQFLLWVILTSTITTVGSSFLKEKFQTKKHKTELSQSTSSGQNQGQAEEADGLGDLFKAAGNINIPVIILGFIFYFLGGYLLYSALFAAIGSAVDSEADTQQFMLPITIPLILSFMVAQYVISSPDGPIAFWFSIIPFTSPVVMMVRLPFGVPAFDLILSMIMLVVGFIFTTWIAGKIYRTGILMYGKKPTFAEIGKWLFYKA